MTNAMLPGVGGSLFPARYLATDFWSDIGSATHPHHHQQIARLSAWWARVSSSCGPATGIRAVFDRVAMPLFDGLRFRAIDACFSHDFGRVHLVTGAGASVALLVLPWARRPSGVWRDAIAAARDIGADWCFVLAPPFLTLVPARAGCLRRTLEFSFPDALHPRSADAFLRLADAAAFERGEGGSRCVLDTVVERAATFQDQVRADLQSGVLRALPLLTSVLRPARSRPADESFDEALTLIYRILFLLFAESRELVPTTHPIYRASYAVSTLCSEACRSKTADGLWDALAAVSRLSRTGCRIADLRVFPFNGALFARSAAPSLEARQPARRSTASVRVRDRAVHDTLVSLATRSTAAGREEICYSDLGVEQLGAVYERVLDLDPAAPADVVARRGRHSRRRKESGTFYTPQEIAELVIRQTLAPLVAGRSSDRILELRVIDPAMGSGAFLVAACRYLADAYERAIVDEGRCSESDVTPARRADIRRLVAGRCLAGVDSNPVAVQLARLSLWLATLSEGKPVGFLDHRLRVGNSLIGAWPSDLRRVSDRPARSRAVLPLFDDMHIERPVADVTQTIMAIATTPDDTAADVHAKAARWLRLLSPASPVAQLRHALDVWCARWFWPDDAAIARPSAAELRAVIDMLLHRTTALRPAAAAKLLQVAADTSRTHRFFHWPLEFSDVFHDVHGHLRADAGFDAVIGNPPWEMVRSDSGDREPHTGSEIAAHKRQVVRYVRDSGLYASCDRGQLNLYQPFVERSLALVRPGGRIGLVLPWGLAVDDGAAALRRTLLDDASIETVIGLDNSRGLFPIHRGLRFMVVVADTGRRRCELRGRFGVTSREEIAAMPGRDDPGAERDAFPVRLSPQVLARVGGTHRRIPDARRSDDIRLLTCVTASHPPLGSHDGWNIQFGRELNVTDDRTAFGTSGLPVLEGKHVRPFVADVAAVRYRINRPRAMQVLRSHSFLRPRLAYRDVSGVANRLSLIAAVVPAGAVTTHTLFCIRPALGLDEQHFLCAVFNSYVLNAVVRLLMGSHVTTSLVESLAVPRWTGDDLQRRLSRAAAALSRRHDARRHAWLQAVIARLYGFDRTLFQHALNGFPLVEPRVRELTLGMFERFGL